MLGRLQKLASFLFTMLLFGITLASHHCHTTVKNEGSRVKLDLGCEMGKFTWINPKEERAITFTDKKRSFKVCLDSALAGANVYRLEGSARTLLSANSQPGRIGCLESDCKHVTLLLQASSNDTLEYNYTTSITNVCPKCTSYCQRKCFCNSEYVFVAEVSKSRRHKQHYYQNYVKIQYFLRHHGRFTSLLGRTPPSCDGNSSHTHAEDKAADHENFVPMYGKLKVKSKCSLQAGRTYLFSASLRLTRHSSRKPNLTMCCAQEDYKQAWESYSYLLNNHHCCPSTQL